MRMMEQAAWQIRDRSFPRQSARTVPAGPTRKVAIVEYSLHEVPVCWRAHRRPARTADTFADTFPGRGR
jgi:hypothetical protein